MSPPTQPQPAERLPELDILRGCAVLLVIWHHADYFEEGIAKFPLWLWRLCYYSQRGGWTGVDLFFVLSGFLISGLLFREKIQRGKIAYLRFFVRRGLKIYPAFYVLLAVTVLVIVATRAPLNLTGLVGELLYLQNYVGALWGHTWSLAIEEHFYLLLPLILLVLSRVHPDQDDPYRRLPQFFAATALLIVGFRTWSVVHRANLPPLFDLYIMTHTRLDALFFGVCLSYFFHFHRSALERFLNTQRLLQLVLMIALISIPFLPRVTNRYNYSIGFTLNYLGYGLLLMHFIFWKNQGKELVLKGLSWLRNMGQYSYSIYLWHLPILTGCLPLIKERIRTPVLFFVVGLPVYLALSVGVGILLSKLIEFPVLRLRDRIFPSRCGPLTKTG